MTQQSRESEPDPIGDFQRWLFRSGVRGMSRELGGQIRTVLGMNGGTNDVWERATAGPPPDEAPECAWCPVCRAARMLRESRPGFASQLAAAGGAFATVVQEVASAVEAAIASAGQSAGEGRPRAGEGRSRADEGRPRADEGRPRADEGGPRAGEGRPRAGERRRPAGNGRQRPGAAGQPPAGEPRSPEPSADFPDEPDHRG